jgi:phage terminase large subunit-like protein
VAGRATVVDIEFLGPRELVALGTSTKTLFVNGLFSHNSAAVTRDQARIVFNAAKAMAKKAVHFRKRGGVEVLAHAIVQDSSNSGFLPLSADARTLDGLNVHCAILDELAQHKQREVHDVIETATGKRHQPMMLMITTAGHDQGGIGYEIHDYAEKILEGTYQDESMFTAIWTIDEDMDWADERSWRIANPNWGVSVMPETIKQLAQRAIQVPSFQNAFKIKHLNLWTNAAMNFIDSVAWSKQAVPVDLEDMAGMPCMIGLDLASKVDVAALVRVFRLPNDADVSSRHPHKYVVVPTFYLPEAAVQTSNTNYQGWSLGGHLKTTPGEALDFEVIEEDLQEDFERFDVQGIAYDPWQATQLAQRMTTEGLPMIEFANSVRNMSEPMKSMEAFVRQGLLFHSNSPVMNWMASNLVAQEDRKANVFPRKNRPEQKIDGMVALIMALGRWLFQETEEEVRSVYDNPDREVLM